MGTINKIRMHAPKVLFELTKSTETEREFCGIYETKNIRR